MAVAPGTRIGPYEVVALLVTGGMGEVYRATDPRLGRGLEDLAGSSAIVMELVDGPSLADLIARGPVGVAESARIASQIAEGMSSAHARGIVHRDLKPSNVRIAPDGRVKILDLGLAKMVARDSGTALEHTAPEDAETLAVETREGTVLGTAAYMSPEQAVGAPIDARTDVWAFGAVLLEMLTGRRAFPGRTITDTLAAVLRGTVDWEALPADVPREVRLLIERCLVREASGRLSDLGEARDVLRPFADPGFVAAPHASADTKSIVVLLRQPEPRSRYRVFQRRAHRRDHHRSVAGPGVARDLPVLGDASQGRRAWSRGYQP